MKTAKSLLISLSACKPALEWASEMTIEEIVRTCHRGDWLLWLAKRVDMNIKPLTLAKARCAKTVIHLMKDQRSIDAVNLAERFGLTDEVTLEDLQTSAKHADAAYAAAAAAAYAAYAADAYAAAAAAAYAAYAADAAAYVADAAYAAAYAAYAAAYAAYAADAAAYVADAAYAADAAARTKNRLQTADICRETFGELLIELVNLKLNEL